MIAEPDDARLGYAIGRRLTRGRPAGLGDRPAIRAGEGDDLGLMQIVPSLMAGLASRFVPGRPLVAARAAVAMFRVARGAAVMPLAAAMIATPRMTPVR